jgi:hypothetical protein
VTSLVRRAAAALVDGADKADEKKDWGGQNKPRVTLVCFAGL